jgi:hypothetical protein
LAIKAITRNKESGSIRLVLEKVTGFEDEDLQGILNPNPTPNKGDEVRDAITSIIHVASAVADEFSSDDFFNAKRDEYLAKKSATNSRESRVRWPLLRFDAV